MSGRKPAVRRWQSRLLVNLRLQALERRGNFLPYGGATNRSGEIVMVGGYDGNEHPPANEIIHLIKQGFIQSAESGGYKATALVYDARVTLPSSGEKSDAIAVSLNHKDNYSVIVLFPYTLQNNQLSIGEPFAQYGEADVFPPTSTGQLGLD